jgi:hypothetical protein
MRRRRRIIRGEFGIIREKLYSCKLSFNMAKEEPVSIDTYTTSESGAQGMSTTLLSIEPIQSSSRDIIHARKENNHDAN